MATSTEAPFLCTPQSLQSVCIYSCRDCQKQQKGSSHTEGIPVSHCCGGSTVSMSARPSMHLSVVGLFDSVTIMLTLPYPIITRSFIWLHFCSDHKLLAPAQVPLRQTLRQWMYNFIHKNMYVFQRVSRVSPLWCSADKPAASSLLQLLIWLLSSGPFLLWFLNKVATKRSVLCERKST